MFTIFLLAVLAVIIADGINYCEENQIEVEE